MPCACFQVYVNLINPVFASLAKTLLVRFAEIWTGDISVAGATLYRILLLLGLLGLGFLSGGSATANDKFQYTNVLNERDSAEPSWYIATQTRERKKPSCLHAFEHSHETCQACGKIVVLRSTNRLRSKSAMTKSKSYDSLLPVIQLYPAAGVENATARLSNGSWSQAGRPSAKLFASTGRRRI